MKHHDIFESQYYNLMAALVLTQRIVEKYAEKSSDRISKMTPDQQYVCDVLATLGSGAIADFTRLLIREPSSVAQILGRLEEKNIIHRETLPGTRKLIYTLTDPENTDGLQDNDRICRKIFSGLTDEEQKEFKRMLDKLFDSVREKLDTDHYSSPFSFKS
ncbi:MarR family transcriptional regulator [Dehalococcoides mccartyi]|uniref:MarR family transcriptional regulator n=1 Tax=Dehalococcoides mccartyi TaxID=61435 RepID=A0A2J1E094_9CHLR|nr:MarR family transcriptional regulator [Dehalococcoides mccartyi]PKH47859.1 MarR family transcriptional regulator [Dehalococcoides mccartyi]